MCVSERSEGLEPFGRRSIHGAGSSSDRELAVNARSLCEHAFVSIKGGAYRWLRAALERGDLASARSAAAEIGRLNLADAASVVLLMAAARDPAYERAAVRWLERLAAERPGIALDRFAAAAAALVALRGSA